MLKRGLKKHLFSGVFTVIVIALLILATPANAIDVALNTPDINAETDLFKTLTIEVDIHNGEFLPLAFTQIDFDNNAGDLRTCTIDDTNAVLGCDFLSVLSKGTTGLLSGNGFGYGYGYGYGYGSGILGYSTDFGFDTGTIVYTLEVDVSKLPTTFLQKTINAEARVYGADASFYTGQSVFSVLGLTNGVAVNKSLGELTFDTIKKENTAVNEIKTNLNLVQLTPDNVVVTWGSSNINVINPFSGQVKRPVYTDTDKAVTLTATLTKGTSVNTKSFSLTVLKEQKSDTQSVDDALTILVINDLLGSNVVSTSITSDLVLPSIGIDGTLIAWSSSNKSVIETSGSVIRPGFDTSVTLTANAKKGVISKTKQFTFIAKGTTDLNELTVNTAKLALTSSSVLNGNPAKDNILGDVVLRTSLTGYPGVAISWGSSNTSIVALNGSVFRDNIEDKQVTLTATLSKSGKTATKTFELTIKKKIPPAVAVAGKVEMNEGEEEVVIDTTNTNSISEVQIPNTVNETQSITLNVQKLVDQSTKQLQLASNQSLTLTRKSSSAGNDIKVEIPQGTKIQGEANWNGLIIAPTIKTTTDVTVTSGTTKKVVEVGLSSGKLTFDKATKLTIPGEAGESAGFVRDGVFTVIPACTAGQIADPNTLPAEGDCFTTSGADLIIWTKHFTQFVSFTPNPEVCDGTDNDGDTLVDEGVTTTFYRDSDGDGYGDNNFPTQACGVPTNYVSNNQDCNDGSVSVKPGATEVCNGVNDNCANGIDEGGVCSVPGVEICNNIDDDTDGQTDEGLTRSITCGTGVCGASATQTCNAGNWVGTCSPNSGNARQEVADSADNDCDGQVDNGFSSFTFYLDTDGDDFGQGDARIQSSIPQGQYSALVAGDCRPGDKSSYPGATELCDGNDNNCNNLPDDVENIKTQCYDVADRKYAGVGACSYGYYTCLGDKFSDSCTGDVAPIAEICDGLDNDCNGQTDEIFDGDGDGYTTCGTKTDGTDKIVDARVDCRDNDSTISPGTQEMCNGVDDDCSGTEDDNLVYPNADNQNGVCAGVVKVCQGVLGWEEPEYSLVEDYEEGQELTCDGRDNNCDGRTDEGHPNLDGDRLADCVDPDADNDRIVDNRDAIIGTPVDSNSNAAYKFIIAGDEFTGRGVREIDGRRQISIEEDGRTLAWLSYIFDPTNLLDFRDVILNSISQPVDETGRGSSLLISGVNSPSDVRKSYLIKRFDNPSNNMVCVKTSQINSIEQMSAGCTMSDELLIPCNGRNVLGFRCTQTVKDGVDIYRVDGVGYYAISEVSITPSDFSRDNKVDFDDFFAFADHFGEGLPASQQARMKTVSTETFLALLSSPEVCDSRDNNGDGSVDEDLTQLTGDTDEGTCDYGLDKCMNGEWVVIAEPDNSCEEVSSSSDRGSRSSSRHVSTCEGSVSCSWSELNEASNGCGELRCSNSCGELWVEETLSCQPSTETPTQTVPTTNTQPAKKPAAVQQPEACELKGDFDDNGRVDYEDFYPFADNFGSNVEEYDITGDGRVDYEDFYLLADDFGKSC